MYAEAIRGGEPLGGVALLRTLEAGCDIDVEQQGEIRTHRALHEVLELRDAVEGESSPRSLVGVGRVGETVADHPGARLELRLDEVLEMRRPRRKHEQQLRRIGQHLGAGREHQLADLLGERGASGLARQYAGDAPLGERAREPRHLSALAHSLDAFDGEEPAALLHLPVSAAFSRRCAT